MHSGKRKKQFASNLLLTIALFILVGSIAGASVGWILGWIGGVLPHSFRSASATLLALGGIIAGAVDLLGGSIRPPQRNIETPRAWTHYGPLKWAALNGLALGVGFTSRIGFWLWYVVPCVAVLVGEPVFGAMLYGIYAFARTSASGVLVAIWMIRFRGTDLGLLLVGLRGRARRVAGAQLIAVASIVLLLVSA